MQQENRQFSLAFNCLSPEIKNQLQYITDHPPLPHWHEKIRGTPNVFLLSALFGLVERGKRKKVAGEAIPSLKGLSISVTGWQFDQSDFDVLLHALNLASRQPKPYPDGFVQFTVKGFLKAIGRSSGKSGREWLKTSFSRMTQTSLEIKVENPGSYRKDISFQGPLISDFLYDPIDHTYLFKLHPQCGQLFEENWTMLNWEQRTGLHTDLAKWLHAFYSSHRTPYPVKVQTLKQLCGSSCRRLSDFRTKLRFALRELITVEILITGSIDHDDKVHVQRFEAPHPTTAQ
jgi:TrfA protein